jgi:hypothetical protein
VKLREILRPFLKRLALLINVSVYIVRSLDSFAGVVKKVAGEEPLAPSGAIVLRLTSG